MRNILGISRSPLHGSSRPCHCEEPVWAMWQSLNSKGGDCFAWNDRFLANVILEERSDEESRFAPLYLG